MRGDSDDMTHGNASQPSVQFCKCPYMRCERGAIGITEIPQRVRSRKTEQWLGQCRNDV